MSGYRRTKFLFRVLGDNANAMPKTTRPPSGSSKRAPGTKTKKATPNNYFHVRVYTDGGSKFEVYRDKHYPSTRAQIIAGLRHAIELIQKLDEPVVVPEEAQRTGTDDAGSSVTKDVRDVPAR